MRRFLLSSIILAVCLSGCKEDSAGEDLVVSLIDFSTRELSVKVGETYSLTVLHTPSELIPPIYEWQSSNENVVSVNDGEITAKSVGESVITVLAPSLQLSSTCKVIVKPVEASKIELSIKNKTMEVDETLTLEYTILPENTTHKNVVWESSDNNIATVTNGVVTSILDGECDIIATIANTDISDKCSIIVNPVRVNGITLSENQKTIEEKEFFTLSTNILPANAKDQSVTWESSDISVATVNNGTVTAVKMGECTITATTIDGGYKSICNVKVNPISVKNIQLDATYIKILIGDEYVMNYTITPSDAANKAVRWESSDTSILTISDSGKIETLNVGVAVVTATSLDGNFESMCVVHVAGITEMMDLFIQSSSVVSISGYLFGDVYDAIRNTSSKNVTLLRFEIWDSNSRKIVFYTENQNLLGVLGAGETKSLGGSLNSVYNPLFVWYFSYNGQSYTVSHYYKSI